LWWGSCKYKQAGGGSTASADELEKQSGRIIDEDAAGNITIV